MAAIPIKVLERFKSNLGKLQKVVEHAKKRDINEADTVVIVTDILSELFGYDKYTEITREYAIKNTYCDLAIKIDQKLKFLIEVKAIGITLNDKHYQQALDYGANNGTEWIILTNGLVWKIYKVRFEKPIRTDYICEFNLLDMKIKNQGDLEKLFILCKEGLKKNAIDDFTQHKMIVNKYFIGEILQSDSVIGQLKKEFKKIDPLMKMDDSELIELLLNDVIKRDVLDAQEAVEAKDKYSRCVRRIEKRKSKGKDNLDKQITIDSNNIEIS